MILNNKNLNVFKSEHPLVQYLMDLRDAGENSIERIGLEPLNAFYNVWLLSKELHYHCAIFPFWWRRRESNSRLTGASCMFSHYYYNPIKILVDRKGFEPLTQECKSRIFPSKLTAHLNYPSLKGGDS